MLAAPGERRERRSEATATATATAKVSSSSSSPVGRAKRPDRAETREKYQPLDAETTSLLHGICGRFGHLPPDPSAAYILSIDFGEALEDLARLLGSDEGQVLVRLGEMQVMARHLVPMLVVLSRDRFEGELITVLNLINLLLCSEVEANRASQEVLLDLRRQYKRVFESSAVMEALLNVAVTCVAPQPETAEMDGEILKRVFTLIRNLLAIPDASEQYVAANVSLASTFGRQERLVTHMQEARLIEFLLVAAGSCNDRRDRRLFGPHVPLLLEIFHCMFRVYDPSVIAAMHGFDGDGPQTCAAEEALQRERTIQRPVRHGRFSGTVVVRLSTGEDYVMSSRQLDRSLTLDPGKRIQHRPKKWALEDFGALSSGLRSSEKMAIFRVVLQFIRESFPELAVAFAERLDLQNPQAALEWNALRLMAWTVRFARQVLAADGAGGSADLSLEHLYGAVDASLMIRIARATRRFLNEKQHSLVMASICYFREALRLIDLMAHTAEPVSIAEHAKTIQMEFFYRQEVVGILRLVLHHSQRLSLKMLAVLVEANHVLLKLLHSYCTSRALVFVSTARRGTAGGGGGGGGEGKGEDEEEAEDEDEDETGQERQFYFEQFVQDYCTENIIDALVRLLRHADGMDASVNRFVAALIHWILVKVKMPGLFYRVSLLDAIHCCLSSTSLSWRRRNPDLLKVCAAVARSFLRELRRDPTLIVAAFFNPGYAARRAMSRGTSRGEEPRGGRSEPARLPEHWSLEEKLRWLVRSLVDGEQSSTVSWLIGKLYDAAASRTVHSPAEADKTEERSFECYYLFAQTDSLKAALDNPSLQTLLVEIGVEAPRGDERSWQIPASRTAAEIIERAHMLQVCLRDALDVDAAPPTDTIGDSITRRSSRADSSYLESDHPAVLCRADGARDGLCRADGSYDAPRAAHTSDDALSDANASGSSKADLSDDDANATASLPERRPIARRWAALKRSNFFLSHPHEPSQTDGADAGVAAADTDGPHYDSSRDDVPGHEEEELLATRPKRPLLMIASEEE